MALPKRKVIRGWVAPLIQHHTWFAIGLLLLDWVGLVVLLAGTVMLSAWWAKLLCGCAAGIMIGRLFVIGHDACHQSYTRYRGLNKVLGRFAMVPSLTPYSLWQVGHNVVHHGYTNLKGVDFVWAPLTRAEYLAMPGYRRVMERIYRSGMGSWLYYFVEMWWLRMFFPSKKHMSTRRGQFFWDSSFAAITACVWIGILIVAAHNTDQSAWVLVGYGFFLPFLVWNTLIGFVVYVHHTHTAVCWHDKKSAWANSAPFISTTVHLVFRFGVGKLLHHIMEHTAHHVDMSVPLYNLQDAQQLLEDTLPGRIVVQQFSWKWYFDTARSCKLFDFDRQCWTDFAGHPTSATGLVRT